MTVEEPHQITVPCLNHKDGCKFTVSFMGVKPVRKICPICQEYGVPTDRAHQPGNVEKATRALRREPIPRGYGGCYGDEILVLITVWPKTHHGGRVMPYHVEG